MKRVLCVLENGVEETELVAPVDVLRRAEVDVVMASFSGELEVTGKQFGKSPLVKIAGKVARLIDRYDETIAVQIPKNSAGGEVTVHAGGKQVVCGKLRILGND